MRLNRRPLAVIIFFILGASISAPVSAGTGNSVSAAYTEETPHCVIDVGASGVVNSKSAQRCYTTYADVLHSLGYANVDSDVSPTDENLGNGDFTAQAQIIQAVVIDYGPSPDYTATITAPQSCNWLHTFDAANDNRFDGIDHRTCNRAEHHYYACDSTPDFVTIGPESGYQTYPSTHQNKEDCIHFKVS